VIAVACVQMWSIGWSGQGRRTHRDCRVSDDHRDWNGFRPEWRKGPGEL